MVEELKGKVDEAFLAKFEAEWASHQEKAESELKQRRKRKQYSRKGSRTPVGLRRTRRKRARPNSGQSSKSMPQSPHLLPNVAWGSPRSSSGQSEGSPSLKLSSAAVPVTRPESAETFAEHQYMDEVTLVTKTVCLPYLKQLQYVDMQLNLHSSLLETRERERMEKLTGQGSVEEQTMHEHFERMTVLR